MESKQIEDIDGLTHHTLVSAARTHHDTVQSSFFSLVPFAVTSYHTPVVHVYSSIIVIHHNLKSSRANADRERERNDMSRRPMLTHRSNVTNFSLQPSSHTLTS